MEQTCSCGSRLSEPYDAGYNLGWNDARAGRRSRRRLRLGYRADSLAEAALGYAHGRIDGVGRNVDWWPAYAHGAHFSCEKTALPVTERTANPKVIAEGGMPEMGRFSGL